MVSDQLELERQWGGVAALATKDKALLAYLQMSNTSSDDAVGRTDCLLLEQVYHKVTDESQQGGLNGML